MELTQVLMPQNFDGALMSWLFSKLNLFRQMLEAWPINVDSVNTKANKVLLQYTQVR